MNAWAMCPRLDACVACAVAPVAVVRTCVADSASSYHAGMCQTVAAHPNASATPHASFGATSNWPTLTNPTAATPTHTLTHPHTSRSLVPECAHARPSVYLAPTAVRPRAVALVCLRCCVARCWWCACACACCAMALPSAECWKELTKMITQGAAQRYHAHGRC